MGSSYYLEIVSNEEIADGEYDTVALVHGDLETINFVGTRAVKTLADKTENDGDYSLEFIETERLGAVGDPKRTVTRVSSDAGTVASVLKDKLKKERAQAKVAAADANDSAQLDQYQQDGQPTPLVAEKVEQDAVPGRTTRQSDELIG